MDNNTGVLPPIKKHDPVAVQSRIKELEEINLCNMDLLDVKKCLCNSLHIPENAWIQKSGFPIYRGRINKVDNPFENKKCISYNPNLAESTGRANLGGEKVFYGASNWEVAAIEACQDALRNSDKREFYVTVGKWIIVRDFNIGFMCHSTIAQSVKEELKKVFESIDNMMKEESKTEEEYKSRFFVNKFFSDQFAKTNIKCSNEYFYSAFCTSEILKRSGSNIQGIWYPSVGGQYYGFNFVLKTSFIDDGFVEFNEACFQKLVFKDKDSLPKFEFLKYTSKFENDQIDWL